MSVRAESGDGPDHDRVPTPVPGPQHPVPETPALASDAIRRTTSIDVARPDGPAGPIVADIRGRDVLHRPDGGWETLDALDLRVGIDQISGEIVSVVDQASHDRASSLVGTSVRRGFGAAVVEAMPDEAARRTLLFSALEDLNGASLVSGYALLRAGLLGASRQEGEARAAVQQDICAGWARGGAVVERLRLTGDNAIPYGPAAPPITELAGAWHPLAPMALGTVRRLRRLDVHRDRSGHVGPQVVAHFRDTYGGVDEEMVMHEYLVQADVGRPGLTLEHVAVDPRVLPWSSCPNAVASAETLNGTPVAELARRVRAELVGPSTCTHLNSTMRSLADVDALIAALERTDRA